eukprot:2235348-Rhodomonas_salina.4
MQPRICCISAEVRVCRGGGGDACTGGLQRTNLAPVVVTQCELPDGRACLFGACNDWLWLVVVQDLNTADLNKEFDSDADDDNLPDQLPPTFFVNDRYDAN